MVGVECLGELLVERLGLRAGLAGFGGAQVGEDAGAHLGADARERGEGLAGAVRELCQLTVELADMALGGGDLLRVA